MNQQSFNTAIPTSSDIKILGADPGKYGGIAVIDGRLNVLGAISMPKGINGRAIAKFTLKHKPDIAIIEKVGSRPKDGHMNSFTFGRNTGKLIGVVEVFVNDMVEVHPNTWKSNLKLNRSGKEGSVKLANMIFNRSFRIENEGIAEALLIAYWGLLTQTGPTMVN